jgi:hypothetical protein
VASAQYGVQSCPGSRLESRLKLAARVLRVVVTDKDVPAIEETRAKLAPPSVLLPSFLLDQPVRCTSLILVVVA